MQPVNPRVPAGSRLAGTLPEEDAKPAANSAGSADSGLSRADREKVEAAAEKFESLFIGEMLKQMRRTTAQFATEDSVYKNRINQDMLEMADTAVADALSGQRAFGIADAILKQLLPAQQAAAPLTTALPPRNPSQAAAAEAGAALHAAPKPVASDR